MFNRHSVQTCTIASLSPTYEVVYSRTDQIVTPSPWTVEFSTIWVDRYIDQFGRCFIHRHIRSNVLLVTPDTTNRLNFTEIKVSDPRQPIIMIDGIEVFTFKEASLLWLGYIHPNIKDILINEDSVRIEFELKKLKLLYTKKEGKVNIPIFKYDGKGKQIYGLKGLQTRFPDCNLEQVRDKFKLKDRSTAIIDKYQLELVGNNLISVKDGLYTFNFTDFREYLREQQDGISNQTWAKVRDELIYKNNHI